MNHRLWMKWTVAVAAALAASSAYASEAVVSGDTYVSSSYPANNFGYQSNLHVNSTSTALIVFDLSSVPSATASSQISKATLWLYVNRISSSGAVSLKPVTSTWTELAVTYNTIPALGSAVVTFTPTVAQQFVAVDVTSLVQGWVTTPSSNYGVALSTVSGSILFDSKENGETSHMAKLDITLVNQGSQGAQGPPGATGAPGATGPQGLQGLTGATGAAGPQGQQGLTGATGPQGPQGTVGATGATGATGSAGPAGATGPQGSPVTFRGAWNIGSTYAIGDTVSESGNSYIAIAAATAEDPATDVGSGTSGTYWALLAKKGDAGDVGATGSAGAVGPQGSQGPAGATGATGAQGSAATVAIGSVTTGSAGSSASVTNSGTSSAATFNFTIPQGATGTGFANGTVGGQIYLTASLSPFAPAAPQTVTGDVTISSSGATTIGPGTVTANKIANNAITSTQIANNAITSTQIASGTITGGNIANSTIGVANLNASGTASSSTYLRGDGTWSTPGGGSSNTYSTGSLSTGTISSSATTVFYTVADGNTITLPASPVSGQHIILIDPDCSESNSGFTLKSNTSQSLFLFTSSGDLIPGTSVTIFCNAELVYFSGNLTWYSIGGSAQ
jgi:Collagen triple helix repeat (20 copies)